MGLDFPLHADPAAYREAVSFIKGDPLALGALVTTHKMDLFAACQDLFDKVDRLSAQMGEVSCLYKRGGDFVARAVDPYTADSALVAFLPKNHWQETGAEVLILGAGGSAISLVWTLSRPRHGRNRPRCIHVANRSTPRLEHLQSLHNRWATRDQRWCQLFHGLVPNVELRCHHVPQPEAADALCSGLPPGSLVVNATGLGKDAPGSPLTNAAQFPARGLAWEFNYRGDLIFLDQARAQQKEKNLTLEDGWVFFLHGWLAVISLVCKVKIPPDGPLFEELSQLAAECR